MRFGPLALILALGYPSVAPAGDPYVVDPVHSSVAFKIRHLVGTVTGHFRDFQGTIDLDREEPARSSVAFEIRAASIDTGNPKRDEHLRSPDFFDVDKHPTITFRSKRIARTSGNRYAVTGDFTLHGVTKELTLPVEFLGTARDPWGNERAGFSASTTLDRKAYGIVWNQTLDTGGLLLGDEVEVTIAIEAILKKPSPPAAQGGSS
jgi:polyisoprenoid-binding protein YceI